MAWPAPTSCAAFASTPNSKAFAVSAFCASPEAVDVEQLPCGVDGLVLTARAAVAHLTVASNENQPGGVGVDGAWHMRR